MVALFASPDGRFYDEFFFWLAPHVPSPGEDCWGWAVVAFLSGRILSSTSGQVHREDDDYDDDYHGHHGDYDDAFLDDDAGRVGGQVSRNKSKKKK